MTRLIFRHECFGKCKLRGLLVYRSQPTNVEGYFELPNLRCLESLEPLILKRVNGQDI